MQRRPEFGALERSVPTGDEGYLNLVLSLSSNKVSWQTLDSLSPELRALINEYGEVDVAQIVRLLKTIDLEALAQALETNRLLREKRRWAKELGATRLAASRTRTRGGVERRFG